ncbi:protein FAM166A [Suncus etruscus]|uniref:protein FAM166A n=1 Tax=Suncus etruscus TaxID=109475 RepID=UPI00210FC80C|nr:protein FAM166A [Suncus etruscus]
MEAAPKHPLFTPEPHYIPGYAGFYPQLRFQVGNTYGHTTAQLLTDPGVHKSPCSVLSPITKPKFIEDYSQPKAPFVSCRDLLEPHIPHYSGLKPYKDFKILDLFQAPDLQGQLEAEDEALLPTDFMPYPPFAPCRRTERKCQGPLPAGPVTTGGGTSSPSPGRPQETLNVQRFTGCPSWTTQTSSSARPFQGYAGFVPRFTWVMGINYRDGVIQAMDEFDQEPVEAPSPRLAPLSGFRPVPEECAGFPVDFDGGCPALHKHCKTSMG